MKILTEKQFNEAIEREIKERDGRKMLADEVKKLFDKFWELREDVDIIKNDISILTKELKKLHDNS